MGVGGHVSQISWASRCCCFFYFELYCLPWHKKLIIQWSPLKLQKNSLILIIITIFQFYCIQLYEASRKKTKNKPPVAIHFCAHTTVLAGIVLLSAAKGRYFDRWHNQELMKLKDSIIYGSYNMYWTISLAL